MRTLLKAALFEIKPIFVVSCLMAAGLLATSPAQAISQNTKDLVGLMTAITAGRQTESFSCTLNDRRPGASGKVDYEIIFDNTPPLSKVLSLSYYPLIRGEDGHLTRNAFFDSSENVNVLELVYDPADTNFLVGFKVEDLSSETPLIWEGKRVRRGAVDLHELVVKTRSGEIVSRGLCQEW